MYQVDKKDKVFKLHEVPKFDIGAPIPVVLATDVDLVLAYYVSQGDKRYSPRLKWLLRDSIAVITFTSFYAHMFGPPNDEAFAGHPLSKRGLAAYYAFEIKQSSWLRRLERMNSVHMFHDRNRFMKDKKHFIFAFHDNTFECIADGFDVRVERQPFKAVISDICDQLRMFKVD